MRGTVIDIFEHADSVTLEVWEWERKAKQPCRHSVDVQKRYAVEFGDRVQTHEGGLYVFRGGQTDCKDRIKATAKAEFVLKILGPPYAPKE